MASRKGPSTPKSPSRLKVEERALALPPEGGKVVVVADTHSEPHPKAKELIAREKPSFILHAGDIGDLHVLDVLAEVAPVTAVRGNIDGRAPGLPDVVAVHLAAGERPILDMLLLHIAVAGPRLRGDAATLARGHGASLVVCGHSHVPFVGRDRGLAMFNPGSIGPRRFHLPILFGVIEASPERIRLEHVDCETGERWLPP